MTCRVDISIPGMMMEAKKHFEAGRQQRDRHSHLIAADAYLKFFGGDAKGAIQELEGVLKGPEGGTSGLLYGVLGVVQMHSGDLDGARESLTTARKFADRDVRVNQMLAKQYRRRGAGFELQAITFYESALRLSSDHVPSLLGVSLMLISREQYDEALRNVQKVLDVGDATVSPRQLALARAAKAHVLYAKGKASEGAEEERKALALDPANPDVYAQIGRRKLAGGDVAGAVESFQKAIQSDPRRFSFYADLAGAMMRQEGGARQAVAALLAAQDRLPGNARVVKLLGVVETPEQVADTLGRALQYAARERVSACTNCGMAPMRRDVARGKLHALEQGAALVREELRK